MNTQQKLEMLTFGRILIDKQHMFFGKSDPELCVVADTYYSSDDGIDANIWVDHYRGHLNLKVENLVDEAKYIITDFKVDCSRDVPLQLNELKNIILNKYHITNKQ